MYVSCSMFVRFHFENYLHCFYTCIIDNILNTIIFFSQKMATPNAPKRSSKLVAKPRPLWRQYREAGLIRQKYCHYTPEDVEELDNIELLKNLYRNYFLPSSQPRTQEEWLYFSEMTHTLYHRLVLLCVCGARDCPFCI